MSLGSFMITIDFDIPMVGRYSNYKVFIDVIYIDRIGHHLLDVQHRQLIPIGLI